MEEMLFRMAMMNPACFGGFLLKVHTSDGVRFKSTSQAPCAGVIPNAIVKFECGTGFLIDTKSNTKVG